MTTNTISAEIKSGLTLKVLVIGAIIVILEAILTSRLGLEWHMQRRVGISNYTMGMALLSTGMGMFVIAALVIQLINRIARRPVFSLQESAILLIMVVTAPYWLGWSWGGLYNGFSMQGMSWGRTWSDADMDLMMTYFPDTVAYKNFDYWQVAAVQYNQPINWGPLLPSLLWWCLTYISISFTAVFFGLLLRHLFVDVEALQFPMAEISGDMVGLTQTEATMGEGATIKSKFFWLGFAISAIWIGIVTLPHQLPWFTDLGATNPWNTARFGFIGTDTLAYPILNLVDQVIPWSPLIFILEPWQLGWCTYLSIETLIGAIIGFICWWVIGPSVLLATGVYTGPGSGTWVDIAQAFWYTYAAPGQLGYPLLLGLLLGMGLIPLWKSRHIVIPVVKGLYQEPTDDFDPQKPLPYRWVWIGFIGCLIWMLAMFALGYVDTILSIIYLVFMFVVFIGVLRFMAETGGWFGAIGFSMQPMHGANPYVVGWAAMGNLMSKGAFAPQYTTLSTTNAMTGMWFHAVDNWPVSWTSKFDYPGTLNLQAMKLGQLTNTNNRGMLTALLVSIAITVFAGVGWLMFITHWHTLTVAGIDRFTWVAKDLQAGIPTYIVRRVEWEILERGGEAALWLAIGLALAVIFPYARRRFSWFRISLAGFTLGLWVGNFMWAALIAGLVIKYIIMRTAGIEVYNKKWRPFALGLLAGGWLMMVVTGYLLRAIRWYIIIGGRVATG